MSKNLILGTAEGYAFEDIALFLGSLKKTSFSGSVYFFVHGMNFIDRSVLRNYGINVIPYRKKFPFLKGKVDIHADFCSNGFKKLYVEYYRFIIYYFFLKSRFKEFRDRTVLLTDIRDVVFQNDPFKYNYNTSKLYFFTENKDCPIQENSFNSSWIHSLYGSAVLSEIGKYRCICSGMILGSVELIIGYLDTMIRHISEIQQVVRGGDQAIHEFIIYKEGVDNCEILSNEDGPIMHLHTIKPEDIAVDENGYIRSKNNAIVDIVHQYDRHDFLREAFCKKYNLVKLYPNKIYNFLDEIRVLIAVIMRGIKNLIKFMLRGSFLSHHRPKILNLKKERFTA